MKEKIIFYLFLFLHMNIFSQISQEKLEKFPSLTEIIKTDVHNASIALKKTQSLLKNFPDYFNRTSYTNSSALALYRDDGGIWFDFGYSGHGILNLPFSGFQTKIEFLNVPEWLIVVLKNTLVLLGFKKIISVSPQDEFFIKMLLLFKDVKNKQISSKQFLPELIFLFYRLALVKDFSGPSSFITGMMASIRNMVEKIRVNDKTFSGFLNLYWQSFKDIVNYDFALEEKPAFELKREDLIATNDWRTIFKISFAIGLKSCVDYYVEREKFINTSQGRNLWDQIFLATTKKEKLKRVNDFNNAMPGYRDLLKKTKERLKGFLRRIIGIREFWNKFVDNIKPSLEPFFEAIGLPFNIVFPKFDEIEDLGKIENLYENEELGFDEDLVPMELNQDFDFSDF